MKTGLYQGTQLKQEMKINPRLYQAMDLLYMPLLDLQQHLKQELLNNPFLEMAEEAGEENLFLFGLTAEQVAGSRGYYDPHWHYANERETRDALDLIFNDHFSLSQP